LTDREDSRQQAAGSRQQAAGSRQQAAGSRQQAAGSRQKIPICLVNQTNGYFFQRVFKLFDPHEAVGREALPAACCLLKMQPCFAVEQVFIAFNVIGVGHTAIDRTNGGTLGLFVETYTLSAFIGDDEIIFVGNGMVFVFCINGISIFKGVRAVYGIAIGNGPFHATFINGVVGTFRLAGAAIDALIGDHDGHGCCVFLCLFKNAAKVTNARQVLLILEADFCREFNVYL